MTPHALLLRLRSEPALICPEAGVADLVNGFWLAMEARARAALPFGERLTLDTFAHAVLADQVQAHPDSLAASLAPVAQDPRGYFTSAESLLLAPKSSG